MRTNPLTGGDDLPSRHLVAGLKRGVFPMAGFGDVRISAIVADVTLDHNLILAIEIAVDANRTSAAA